MPKTAWRLDKDPTENFAHYWTTLRVSLMTILRLEREERELSVDEFRRVLGITDTEFTLLISGAYNVETMVGYLEKLDFQFSMSVEMPELIPTSQCH